jgi:glycosyltransferase involved in cell wall biosynthesis
MRVLRRLKHCFDDATHIVLFGCRPDDTTFLGYALDFDFEHVGIVGRAGVADVFGRSHVFIDASVWQGFGRTGVEAMAAGCVPIVPVRGGCLDYAVEGENALVVDTRDEEQIYRAAARLIADRQFRERLARSGLKTASRYTMSKNALSIYLLLARKYCEHFGDS